MQNFITGLFSKFSKGSLKSDCNNDSSAYTTHEFELLLQLNYNNSFKIFERKPAAHIILYTSKPTYFLFGNRLLFILTKHSIKNKTHRS